MKFIKAIFGALVAMGLAQVCCAETYPSKPIRLIVPAAPGAPPDFRARWLAERLRTALGQPLVIDNRPGAAGIIGTQAAARSPADGYTLLLGHQGTLALNAYLYADLPYDPIKDFTPISRLGVSPMLLAVHPQVPAHSVAELIRLAREKPGQLRFGSAGVGSPPYMAGELFQRAAGIDVLHVPYKSAPAALIDLIGGTLTYTFGGIAMHVAHVRTGKLRALAVTSAKRLAALPDIPTVAESGLPGYEYWSWMGICAPSGTPREIVARLNSEISKILNTQEARDWFAEQGSEVDPGTAEEFAAFIKAEHARWAKTLRAAAIKPE
jgi:tripartite-type tricarboxylate transporter receptor subunit TctC